VIRWAGIVVALVTAAAGVQRPPIVRGQEVTFIATGDPSDPPRIVADFNGWEGGEMTPDGDGRTYSLRVALDPAARIEYLVAYCNRFVLDPGNPLTVPAPAGPPRSEFRMPGYVPAAKLPAPHVRGSIEAVDFTSRSGQPRRIRVYVPATTHRPLPMLYVHDGDIVFDALGLPAILDSLMDAGQMNPAFVTFIDAVDRHDDYEPGSPFRSVFTGEIVPSLERRYAVASGRRALLGLSRSTVGAIDACVSGGIAFEACALIAPAIPRRQMATVLSAARPGTRFLIEAGTYDVPLITDARALRGELEQRRLSIRYVESPQGHNHTAFRDRLPALMRDVFPAGK
jgi:enterochelin esterase-like enzyme